MTKVTYEVVQGLYAKFTFYESGIWWCRLRLSPHYPHYRYTREWVCCPGETKEAAKANALRQAQRLEIKAA